MKYFVAFLAFSVFAFTSCKTAAPARTESVTGLIEELSALIREYPDLDAALLSRHYNENIESYDAGHYIVIKRTLESYSGGAHGLRQTHYKVFNREDGKFIALSRYIPADKLQHVKEAVIAALKKQYEVKPGEGLKSAGFFEDDFPLTGNFFITANGTGFHWNPYEIAPYSYGEIEVVIQE